MSESKHTPGPWFVSGVRHRMDGSEWHSINRYDDDKKRDENIACVGFDPRTGVGLSDARLIAAAPQLFEAAKLAMEGVEVLDLLIASIEKHGNYSVESTLGFLNQARCAKLRLSEAIAKAEGR